MHAAKYCRRRIYLCYFLFPILFIFVSILDILEEAEVIPTPDLDPPQGHALDPAPDLRTTGNGGQGHRPGEGHVTDATERTPIMIYYRDDSQVFVGKPNMVHITWSQFQY